MQPYLLPHKRAYLIAGIAGILGFFALLLPFVVVTLFAVPLSFSAFQLASINGGAGVVWLVLLLILATITLAALGLFRNVPLSPTIPLEKQARYLAYSFIAAGAISFLIVFIMMLSVSQYSSALMGAQSTYGGSSASFVSINWGFGAILSMLTSLAILAAGVLPLTMKSRFSLTPYGVQYPYQTGVSYPYPPQASQPYPPTTDGYNSSPYGQPSAPQYPPTSYPPQGQPQYPPQVQYPQQQQQQYPPQYPQQ